MNTIVKKSITVTFDVRVLINFCKYHENIQIVLVGNS